MENSSEKDDKLFKIMESSYVAKNQGETFLQKFMLGKNHRCKTHSYDISECTIEGWIEILEGYDQMPHRPYKNFIIWERIVL